LHNFLLYFPNLFTIQLTFLPYFPNFYHYSTYFSSIFPYHFNIQLTLLPYFPYLHYSTYWNRRLLPDDISSPRVLRLSLDWSNRPPLA
jgi:hypothetical protein